MLKDLLQQLNKCIQLCQLWFESAIIPIYNYYIHQPNHLKQYPSQSYFTTNLEQNLTFTSSISILMDLTQFGTLIVTALSLFTILLFLYLGTLDIAQSQLSLGVFHGQVKFQLPITVMSLSCLFLLPIPLLDPPPTLLDLTFRMSKMYRSIDPRFLNMKPVILSYS